MGLLTAGHTISCANSKSNGGIKKLWLMNIDDLDPTSMVFAAGTGYTTVALDSGKNAYVFEFRRDTAEHREEMTEREDETSVSIWAHELEFMEPATGGQTLVELIQDLSDGCGYAAVYQTYNSDVQFILGYNEDDDDTRPMYLKSNTFATGKKLEDGSFETLILSCANTQKRQVTTFNMSSLE